MEIEPQKTALITPASIYRVKMRLRCRAGWWGWQWCVAPAEWCFIQCTKHAQQQGWWVTDNKATGVRLVQAFVNLYSSTVCPGPITPRCLPISVFINRYVCLCRSNHFILEACTIICIKLQGLTVVFAVHIREVLVLHVSTMLVR